MTKWNIINTFFKNNKGLAIMGFCTGFFYNIVTALIPISFGRFYEFNFGFSSHRLKLLKGLPFINAKEFNHFILFFASLICIRFVFEYINRYLIAKIGERFTKSLRENLFAHQLQINQNVYEEKGVGKYLLRYTSDFGSIKNYLTKGVLKFSQDIILILLLISVSVFINPFLGAIIAGCILVSFIFIFFLNKILYNASLKKRNTHSGLVSYISKALSSILTIKAFNKQRPIENRYNQRSTKLYKAGLGYQNIFSFISSIVPMLTYLMIALVMTYIYSIKDKTESVDQASLLILILVIITFLPIFRRVLKINIVWKLGNISFSKLLNIYALKTESRRTQNVTFKELPIQFNNVKWSENHRVLNFTISPNQITSLNVPSSSSLASEIIKLIIKIHKPLGGQISVGEHSYSSLSEKTIRKQIAIISPALPLEGRTVFKAISYNRKAESKVKAQKILDELQQFVPVYDHVSLDDKIGENSSLLSEQQIQLLIWARALLTGKRVLILHHAFLNVNSELKKHLIKKINRLSKRKTILTIGEKKISNLNVQEEIIL